MKNIRQEVVVWTQLISFVVIWVVVLWASGIELKINWEAMKKLPVVVTIYTLLHFVFTKWLWRSRVFQGWLVPYPDLQGTWKGELKSTYINSETGLPTPPISVVLVVRQSFSSINCTMYSQESESISTAAQINKDESDTIRLSYSYINRPKASVRDRSEIHYGAVFLKVITDAERLLEGEYWTSRKTTGDISLAFKSKKLLNTFSVDPQPN